jgi:hypothetical protein
LFQWSAQPELRLVREGGHMDEVLFARNDLRAGLEATARKLLEELHGWDPEVLLALPEADVVDHLLAAHSVQCPRLHRDQAHLLPVSEEAQIIEDRFFGDRLTRLVTRFTLVVPYDGERIIFSTRASQSSINPPSAAATDGELRQTWTGEPTDAAAVRAHFDSELDKIERHLAWCRSDIDQHNQTLRATTPELVAQRRAKLLRDRELEAGIGFPVRRRSDAASYAVPVRRRRISPSVPPRPTASGPFRPEPVLADADYEAALAVLRNARNALERSPSMTARLNEEQIRDLLLVSLNAQFEGRAGGEVFNGAGKTDILIREGDRNVFIGECKIWKGPKTIRQALDQLLRYLVWRDTKAALLLFVRSGDATEVIKKSIAEIEHSPTYKRRGRHDSDERVDFLLHARGDPAREIQLVFLPFVLGASKPSES